jgi:hypothetical protein
MENKGAERSSTSPLVEEQRRWGSSLALSEKMERGNRGRDSYSGGNGEGLEALVRAAASGVGRGAAAQAAGNQ